ncbi:MAG TPA: hypothetical protein VLU24_04335 [Mycobacterium sp.]|jgi:hypothetical protein|nr:hypothetical protein [Mycobacterium sp.]
MTESAEKKTVAERAAGLSDEVLATSTNEFLRRIVRSASETVHKYSDAMSCI